MLMSPKGRKAKGKSIRASLLLKHCKDFFDCHLSTSQETYDAYCDDSLEEQIKRTRELTAQVSGHKQLLGKARRGYDETKELVRALCLG